MKDFGICAFIGEGMYHWIITSGSFFFFFSVFHRCLLLNFHPGINFLVVRVCFFFMPWSRFLASPTQIRSFRSTTKVFFVFDDNGLDLLFPYISKSHDSPRLPTYSVDLVNLVDSIGKTKEFHGRQTEMLGIPIMIKECMREKELLHKLKR